MASKEKNQIEAVDTGALRVEMGGILNRVLSLTETHKDDKGNDVIRLKPEALELLTISDEREPTEIRLSKDIISGYMTLGARPKEVVIPTDQRGTYDLWLNKETRDLIAQTLRTAGKEELLKQFEERADYDARIVTWQSEADEVVTKMRTLVDLIQHGISNLTPRSQPKQKPQTQATPSNKTKPGEPGAFYLECPEGCGHVTVSKNKAWCVKNMGDHISTKHGVKANNDDLRSSVYQKDETGNKVYA